MPDRPAARRRTSPTCPGLRIPNMNLMRRAIGDLSAGIDWPHVALVRPGGFGASRWFVSFGAGPVSTRSVRDGWGRGGEYDAAWEGRRRVPRRDGPTASAYRGVSADDVGGWNATTRRCTSSASPGCGLPVEYKHQPACHRGVPVPGFTVGDGTSCTDSRRQRRSRTPLLNGTVGRRSSVAVTAARQPDGREGLRLRRSALRRQRQPARHAERTGGPVDVSGGYRRRRRLQKFATRRATPTR